MSRQGLRSLTSRVLLEETGEGKAKWSELNGERDVRLAALAWQGSEFGASGEIMVRLRREGDQW